MKAYDLAVIGGGPGGYVAALRAARLGASVCLVERERLGGTCLHRGCIPTKALHATARHLAALKQVAAHGIRIGAVDFDPVQAMARKDALVKQLEQGVAGLIRQGGVDLLQGDAAIEGPGRLRVRRRGLAARVRARAVVLATGSRVVRPRVLETAGKNLLTSDEILVMQDLPSSLLLVGGGYIGCELAGILAHFGVRVTLVERQSRLLENQDAEGVDLVTAGLKRLGVEIHTGVSLRQVETGEGVRALLDDGCSLRADKLLAAVGRQPCSAGLGLADAGVAMDGHAVRVDAQMRTSVPGVYAIGDLTGSVMLAHVAMHHAEVAVAHILGVQGPPRGEDRHVPSVVFSFPELARAGRDEAACRGEGVPVKVGRFAYRSSGKALCDGAGEGFVKLVADARDDRLLGITVAGKEASALVAEGHVAIGAGLTARQLAALVHPHPTLTEVVQEAARDLNNEAIHHPHKQADVPKTQG